MTPLRTPRRSGRMILEGPEAGYHQNWYAVCLASEIEGNKIVGRDFLDSRVIAYRGESGKAQVLSAYCRHLGADLSVGKVEGDGVVCAFHHWCYGRDGACKKIPASEKIPERARLRAFPTAEKWGLVWAFNGPEPLFDVPGVRGFDGQEVAYRTLEYPVEFLVPPWVLITNSHDYQHLRALHDLRLCHGPSNMNNSAYVLEHDAGFVMPDGMPVEAKLRVTGTNTFSLTSQVPMGTMAGMWTGTRTHGEVTRGYVVSVVPKHHGGQLLPPPAIEQGLDMAHAFMVGFIKEDEAIMQTIHFREGVMVEADKELLTFLKYVREYPRADLLAGYE